MYNGKLYTKDGSYPARKPHRIRMPDGSTKTAEAVTHEILIELGWTEAPAYPSPSDPSAPADTWPVYDWDEETSNWIEKITE